MANQIVQVNVSVTVAPLPATLQQTGGAVSYGGTLAAAGSFFYLTQLSDLTPYLKTPAAISTMVESSNVVTVTTTTAHGLPNSAVVPVIISGVTPVGYNGTFNATVTGTTTFTYPLVASPGSVTIQGTWLAEIANELSQQATTFFAQGNAVGYYVLELGPSSVASAITNLGTYITANPNNNYTPGATGFFYAYLVPRTFDAQTSYLSLLASYENPTAKTYFITTTTLATYTSYTAVMKDVWSLIESPAYGTWATNALTAISYSGGVVTATTTTAHGVAVGQWFQITGVTPTGYNGWAQAQIGTAGTSLVYNLATNPGAETVLGSLLASTYSNAGVGANEFSVASFFYQVLQTFPSGANRVPQFCYRFVYGVTPFPIQGNNSLFTTLQNAYTNYIGTGAEGGISNAIIFWGTTEDGNDFSYWYSIDWMQINLDLYTSNTVINGSNNPINPLYYDQAGINALQGTAQQVANMGINYGLINGNVILTQLDPITLANNYNQGMYVDACVINAVPFITYATDNPANYGIRLYGGLTVIYIPQNGFKHIIYNVNVTEFIA